MKYRKRSFVIDAIQWFPTLPYKKEERLNPEGNIQIALVWECGVWCWEDIKTGYQEPEYFIDTLEKQVRVIEGDWIITGIEGEKYPCKDHIFRKSYDLVGEENKRSSIAVDFDGVIHAYSKGWHDGTCYDEPMEGAIAGLSKLMESFNVFILSTREPQQIKDWMDIYIGIPSEIIDPTTLFWNKSGVLGITNRKLAAIAYIDDRAVPFHSWLDLTVDKR